MIEPPRVTINPSYRTVDIGESIEFQCSATGYPPPTVTWIRGSGKIIPRAAKIDGSNLVLRDIQSEDEGDYICTVTNRGGSVTRKALLYVRGLYYTFISTTTLV